MTRATDDDARDERITIRLTKAERQLLEEAALRERRPVSAWIAYMALQAARDQGRG